MQQLTKNQWLSTILVLTALGTGLVYAAVTIGLPPVLLIGIPGVFAFLVWHAIYLKNPTDPSIIVPPFLITVAGFEFHLIEEYSGHYAPAISRLFNFAWTDASFFVVVCILSGAFSLITIGLLYRKPIAGFVALLFVSTRLSELALFIFPFIRPQLQPELKGPISQTISGSFVANMPTYYYAVVGHYYFPGMYTVILPILPALFTLYRIWQSRVRASNQTP